MSETKKILRLSGITAAVCLGLKYVLPYVLPFLTAYLLVRLLQPLTDTIRKKLPWRREVILGILLVVLVLLFGAVCYGGSCLFMNQIQKAAEHSNEFYRVFRKIIDSCCFFIEKKTGIEMEETRKFIDASLMQGWIQLKQYAVPGMVNYSFRYLKKTAACLGFFLIVLISAVFLEKDYEDIHKKLSEYQSYQHFCRIFNKMWIKAGAYLKAQGMILLVEIGICTAGLWILQNPYFLLLGVLIGLLDALPFIGCGTVLVPMAILKLAAKQYRRMFGILILFAVTYVVREVLEPKLLGETFGVYPIVMVAVVYLGIYGYGLSGVILGPAALLLITEILRDIREKETDKKDSS